MRQQRQQRQRASQSGRAGRPLPPGSSLYTPHAGQARRAVERRSAAPLMLLHQMPPWLLPVILLALLVAGFSVPGWVGAAALLGVAAVLGWLAYVSWPALSAQGRLLRLAAIAGALAVAVLQFFR